MKINSVDIAAFGKFKDFHLDFNDGMTVIFGENENGKTTIMAFIRMMFYGNTGKSSDIDKNPRIKYRPWNADFMAGSITFTHDGYHYRLEREFKKSNSTDKITLIDLDTGMTKTLSGSDDIGAKFFGLTDAAFERSVFIGELGATSKNDSADGEINSKLSNIAVTGDENVSFEKISLKLSKSKETLMSKSGKKGKYDKAQVELEEIENKIKASLEKEQQLEILTREAKDIDNRVRLKNEETSKLFELLKNADKLRKIKRLERYLEVALAAEEADKALTLKDGTLADSSFLAELRAKKDANEKTDDKVQNLLSEIKQDDKRIEELSLLVEASSNSSPDCTALKERLNEINGLIEENKTKTAALKEENDNLKPTRKPRLPLIISGAVLLAASVVPFVLKLAVVGIVLIILGIILAVLGLGLKKTINPDNSEISRELASLAATLAALLEEKQSVLNEIKSAEDAAGSATLKSAANKALLEEKKLEAAGKKTELEALKKFFNEQALKLFEFCSALRPTASPEQVDLIIAELSLLLERKEKLTANLNLLSESANCSSAEDARLKLDAYSSEIDKNISEEELDSAKERFKASSEQLAVEKSALSSINVRIKALADSIESSEVLCRRRDELIAKINEYKKYCDTVDITTSALADAFRELRRNYSGVLDTRAAQIFAKLTNNKYSSVNISKNFEIGVTTDESFGLKEASYLSSGTADQAYLALRLAIAELITEKTDALPIFMDDSLDQYDDKRAKFALEFLKEYAADRQLLLFTCHSYFKDVAKDLSINTFEL